MDGQGTRREEKLPKILTGWIWCTNVTDDRQTDGPAITYSEREREFAFAKKWERCKHTWSVSWIQSEHYCAERRWAFPDWRTDTWLTCLQLMTSRAQRLQPMRMTTRRATAAPEDRRRPTSTARRWRRRAPRFAVAARRSTAGRAGPAMRTQRSSASTWDHTRATQRSAPTTDVRHAPPPTCAHNRHAVYYLTCMLNTSPSITNKKQPALTTVQTPTHVITVQ